jgi:hypothetical protein
MKSKIFWICFVAFCLIAGKAILEWQKRDTRVRALTRVLNKEWNPYNNPPEYLERHPYRKAAYRFDAFMSQNGLDEQRLSEEILLLENEWKLGGNPERVERAHRVAKLLIEQYSQQNMTEPQK